ncbi:hypothetical protein GF407_10160 [candidate division KSB1 bacterium]|nr:hypothetical protein [candidate division KSB1 bacterium]
MLRYFLFFCITTLFCFCNPKHSGELIELGDAILLTDKGTDKGSGYSMQNKIVTSDIGGVRKTHFTYTCIEDTDRFVHWKSMSAWVATFNHQTNEIISRTYIGQIYDNHGTPSLTIDRNGYLHIVYAPHHHPFHYRKSVLPNNSTKWQAAEFVSARDGVLSADYDYAAETQPVEGEWTYPIIKVDSAGIIHVAGSLSRSAAYVRKVDGKWQKPQVLYTARKTYSRYNVMMNVGPRGAVHVLAPDMAIIRRDTTAYYRMETDYIYFRSNDQGATFNRRGIAFSSQQGYIQGNGNLAVDSKGHPHFLAMERDYEQHRWQWHVFFDGREWQREKIQLEDLYIWDSSFTIDDQDRLVILTAANRADHHWRHASNRLLLLVGRSAEHLKIFEVVDDLEELNSWLPAVQENQFFSKLAPQLFFVMWTEETDLHGNYTRNWDTTLSTRVYAKRIILFEE